MSYGVNDQTWTELLSTRAVTFSAHDDPALDYLRMRIQGLEFQLRNDVLAAFENGSAELVCNYCESDFTVHELRRGNIICPHCGSARIFEGLVFERDSGFGAAKRRWISTLEGLA